MTQINKTNNFIIIGAGGFGLMTAFHLRETYKDAQITIFDINKQLSSTVNGGNGMMHYTTSFPIKDIKKSLNINIKRIPSKLGFYIIHTLEYIFNNNKNRNIIKNIVVEDEAEIECNENNKKTDYYPQNYWNKLTDKLISQNIEIKDMTEIIDYRYDNNNIIITSKDNNEYTCDKLILCTAANLKLIKNNYYHKFIDSFSGYSAIIEIKNPPKCFYFKDGIFITPYNETQIKITFKIEVGYNDGNYNMDISDKYYNKLSNYIKKNREIQKLGFISIKKIWRGSRSMTYDMIPFIEQIDNNVYWMTGGSYMGTHMAFNFGKWMVELIDNKPFTKLKNISFDPTLKRLLRIRNKYYNLLILIILIILLILVLI